jgi:hypothetical protein
MRLVFTSSSSIVSKAIMFLTGERASHVALELEEAVIHSSLYGPEVITKDQFYSKRTLVYALNLPTSLDSTKAIVHIAKYDKRLYDYRGLLYLGVRYATKKYLGISLPKVNLWQITGMYTCTEFVSELVLGYEDSLITPYKLYLKLRRELRRNGIPQSP